MFSMSRMMLAVIGLFAITVGAGCCCGGGWGCNRCGYGGACGTAYAAPAYGTAYAAPAYGAPACGCN